MTEYFICYHMKKGMPGPIVITNTEKPIYTHRIEFLGHSEIISNSEPTDIGNGFTPHTYIKTWGTIMTHDDGSVTIG